MRPLVKKFVRETVLSGLDKDDLEQECYLQLQSALEKFDEGLGVPFESYYKIRLYGWRSNQNKRKREVLFEGEEGFIAIDERINVEKEVELKLLFERAVKQMEKLRQIERDIIIGFYLENRRLKEIASSLGLDYKTVEFKKGAALKKLKKYMKVS